MNKKILKAIRKELAVFDEDAMYYDEEELISVYKMVTEDIYGKFREAAQTAQKQE